MSKVLQPAFNKTFRVATVSNGAWTKVLDANKARRGVVIQNRDADAVMLVRTGTGWDVGIALDYYATGKLAGSVFEMREGENLSRESVWCKGASADASVMVCEWYEAAVVPPPADVSSSSSSSSSVSASSASSESSSSESTESSSSASSESSSSDSSASTASSASSISSSASTASSISSSASSASSASTDSSSVSASSASSASTASSSSSSRGSSASSTSSWSSSSDV